MQPFVGLLAILLFLGPDGFLRIAVCCYLALWMGQQVLGHVPRHQTLPSQSSPAHSTGALHVRCGPMSSGKTDWLHSELTRYADVTGDTPLLINSSINNRKEVTHSSRFQGLSPKLHTVTVGSLEQADVSNYRVIGLEEVQFMGPLVPTITKWLKEGKQIYCVGLDSDHKIGIFGSIHNLLHLSDTFVKLSAICTKCPTTPAIPAPFTRRLVPDSGQVLVGGLDTYQSTCRGHHT